LLLTIYPAFTTQTTLAYVTKDVIAGTNFAQNCFHIYKMAMYANKIIYCTHHLINIPLENTSIMLI